MPPPVNTELLRLQPTTQIASTEVAPPTFNFPEEANHFDANGLTKHVMQIKSYNYTSPLEAGFVDLANNLSYTNAVTAARNAAAYARAQITAGANPDIDLLGRRVARERGLAQGYSLHSSYQFYIPEGHILYNTRNQYKETSLTAMVIDGLSEASFIGRFLATGAEVVNGVGFLAGYPINPKVEILFENTLQREFEFEWRFYPVSKEEEEILKAAIRTLRAAAAPTRLATNGIIWKAPNTFDIKFLKDGVENLNIPRISECVIETIEVDYTPTGKWSTFITGHPVATRMRISFRELDPIDRRNIEVNGF